MTEFRTLAVKLTLLGAGLISLSLHIHVLSHELLHLDPATLRDPHGFETAAALEYVRTHLSQRAREDYLLDPALSEELAPVLFPELVAPECLYALRKFYSLQIGARPEGLGLCYYQRGRNRDALQRAFPEHFSLEHLLIVVLPKPQHLQPFVQLDAAQVLAA